MALVSGRFVEFDIRGWREFQEGMNSSLVEFSDSRKLHSRIGITLIKWIDRNFRKEGIEKKWPPLSPTTIRLRRRGSSKPLQDRGILRASFVAAPTDEQVVVGTRDIRSSTHEFGRRQKWGRGKTVTIPQRKMLPTRKAGQPIVRRVYNNFIKESFDRVL